MLHAIAYNCMDCNEKQILQQNGPLGDLYKVTEEKHVT